MKLCVALDLDTLNETLALAKELKEYKIILKVGLKAFIRDGKELLFRLKDISPNFELFLDLKLYDIPNTMLEAVYEIAKLDVNYLTLHASSGKEALRLIKNEIISYKNYPKLLAVTALTSFSKEQFFEIYSCDLEKKVLLFAKDAKESGCDGVVCSVLECKDIKKICGNEFLCVTPGIRPFGNSNDDQKRVATLKDAKEAGSDIIVVGRPIYESKEPKKVIEEILRTI